MATATRRIGARRPPLALARAELAARLQERHPEIEQAILTRVHAVADPKDLDPDYADGLRAAVAATIDFGLSAIESGETHSPLPPAILAQARMAAHAEVSLDTVLRRCFAGHALLGDILIEEAEQCGLQGTALQGLLRTQATIFDRLLAAVSEEHGREVAGHNRIPERRRLERIKRLLAGELIDTTDFSYDFNGFHLGMIAIGAGTDEALRDLSTSFDRRVLLVPRDERTTWAWLGGRRDIDCEVLHRYVDENWPDRLTLALGESAQGLTGWRLTHRQAQAALLIPLRSSLSVARYGDVAILASILQDDLLATSLRELYLAPLAQERDVGAALRETLRAYFASGRHISSTAAVLGTSRQTVAKRLSIVEGRLHRPLDDCGVELEAALRLEDLDAPSESAGST